MQHIQNNLSRLTTIFLDRDGVINKDIGYVGCWENFYFLDGVIETLKIFTQKKIKIIIVTNQSGIARGFYSLQDYKNLTSTLKKFLIDKKINITDIYFCPHHPKGKIRDLSIVCNCRKPSPGMFLQAILDHNIDINTTAMVGDNLTDIEAASAAGIQKNYLINKLNYNETKLNFTSINNLKDVLNYF